MLRRLLIAGNWKMNKTVPESEEFSRELKNATARFKKVGILICPAFVALKSVSDTIHGSNVNLGAQNMHFEESGAFTGDVSTSMLESAGCTHVIIGHSERRHVFGETDDMLNKKLKKAIASTLTPIFCVGEKIEDRKADRTEHLVGEQIEKGFAGVSADQAQKVVIAYEPVWAIGTGETATPQQAEDVHAFIRKQLAEMYGREVADKIIIQYGGSVKPSNANDLLSQENIDGALIGGASLKLDSFVEIIEIAEKIDK